jgi:molybdenum cofactor guanylyltransferase
MTREPLSAAVLAGGQSSRMGTDKALMPLTPGGKPMLQLVLDHLKSVSGDLLVIAPRRHGYDQFSARVVPDLREGGGALVGIHSALIHAVHNHCFVVACDMPFLSPGLLQLMATERRDYDVLVPLLPGTSRQRADGLVFQTLHAIYGKQCVPAIESEIAEGRRQVVGFFNRVNMRTIEIDEVARVDPNLQSFFNVNTPEALSQAQATLSAS